MGAFTTARRVSDISSFACKDPYLWSQGHPNDTWFYLTSLRENDRPEYVGHKIFVKKLDPYRSLYVYLKPKDDLWGEITRFLIALSKPSRKSFRFPKSYRFIVGFFFILHGNFYICGAHSKDILKATDWSSKFSELFCSLCF